MADALKAKAEILKLQADEAEAKTTRFEAECTEKLSKLDQQITSLTIQRSAEAAKFDRELELKSEQAARKARMYSNFAQSIGLAVSPSHATPKSSPASLSSRFGTPAAVSRTPIMKDFTTPEYQASRRASLPASTGAERLRRQPNSSTLDRYTALNATVPTNRFSNVNTSKSSNRKPALTLENFPIVIPFKDKKKNEWIELRCYICNGNAREDGLFLKGLKGLKRHMQLSHGNHFKDLPLKQQFNLEAATVRRFNRQELDAMLAGTIPRVQMIMCEREVATGAEKGINDDDDLGFEYNPQDTRYDTYDSLITWPTIVLRKDMNWIELRCFRCGGNSPDDSSFSEGINGMMKHLKNDHAASIPRDYADFIMKKCQYRVLAPGEFESLDHGGGLRKIEMVPFASGPMSTATSTRRYGVQALSSKEHDEKKPSHLLRFDDDSSSEYGERKPKRPRRYLKPLPNDANATMAGGQHLERSNEQQAFLLNLDLTGKDRVPDSIDLSLFPSSQDLSIASFCPCTISGHPCKLATCEKNAICVQVSHSDKCRETFWHNFKPTCQQLVNIGLCPEEDNCGFGHDFFEERRNINAHHICLDH